MPSSLTGYSFPLAESEALKAHLQGIQVANQRGAVTTVDVRFGGIEDEFTGDGTPRKAQWPYILITLTDVDFDAERAHSLNDGLQTYLIDEVGDDGVTQYFLPYPIPVNCNYVVTTHAREPRHDYMMMTHLNWERFNLRYAGVFVPEDGTTRRLVVHTAGSDASYLDRENKRVFQRMWVVSLASEIPVTQPLVQGTDTYEVLSVLLDLPSGTHTLPGGATPIN